MVREQRFVKEKIRNYILFLLYTATYGCMAVLTTGSVMQTFMLESGIEEYKIAFYTSALQVFQLTAMLLMSRWADAVKDIRKGMALSMSAHIPFFIALFLLCNGSGALAQTKYGVIFMISIFLNVALGFHGILTYKLPHHIMDMQDYGKVSGQAGVVSGIVCMALSMLMNMLLAQYAYFDGMKLLWLLGLLLGILTTVLCCKFRTISHRGEFSAGGKINIFRYKPFYQLILPNFTRGFSAGILNLITLIGYSCNILDAAQASVVVVLTQAASLLSCQSYSLLVGKYRNGRLLLVSAVIFCVAISLAVAGNCRWIFYICYFAAYFFINHINYGVPVLVASCIDYSCLGQYTAWRMALHMSGVAVGGLCVPFLLEHIGAFGTLLACGITALPSGIGYYLFEKQNLRQRA